MSLNDMGFDGDKLDLFLPTLIPSDAECREPPIRYREQLLAPRLVHLDGWRVERRVCQSCGLGCTRTCGICKQIYYCSKHCQERDWRLHKLICPFLRPSRVYHFPVEEDLKKLIKLYGRGSSRDVAVTADKTKAVIWMTALFGSLSFSELQEFGNKACMHADDVLLRFILQCRAVPSTPFWFSKFRPAIVRTLTEYKVAPFEPLQEIVSEIGDPLDFVWYYEGLPADKKVQTEMEDCLGRLFSDWIPPSSERPDVHACWANLVSILLQCGAILSARFTQYVQFHDRKDAWVQKVQWAKQDAKDALATKAERVAQKRAIITEAMSAPRELAAIVLLYAPETIRFRTSFLDNKPQEHP